VRTRVIEEVVPCEEAATAAAAASMVAAGASMAVAEGLDGGAWTAAEGAQIPAVAAARPVPWRQQAVEAVSCEAAVAGAAVAGRRRKAGRLTGRLTAAPGALAKAR
jgi:hypothetical protein